MYEHITNLNEKIRTKDTCIYFKLFLLLYSNLLACLYYLNIIFSKKKKLYDVIKNQLIKHLIYLVF